MTREGKEGIVCKGRKKDAKGLVRDKITFNLKVQKK